MDILIPILVLAIMGAAFGVLLGFAAKAFKVEKDERIEQIAELLPGANCGGCGFAGCGALADALCAGTAPISSCPGLKAENKEVIAKILGVSNVDAEAKAAFVMCSGNMAFVKIACDYEGIINCTAAARLGGDKACDFGCLGFGSCVSVCKFDAIKIVDNLAVVDTDKCTGCGMCADVCPQNTIEILPKSQRTYVKCKSRDKGAALKNICGAGCIGCKICEKNCPKQAIKIENNLAQIDYSLCVNCGICAQKCPRHIIDFTKKDGSKPLFNA